MEGYVLLQHMVREYSYRQVWTFQSYLGLRMFERRIVEMGFNLSRKMIHVRSGESRRINALYGKMVEYEAQFGRPPMADELASLLGWSVAEVNRVTQLRHRLKNMQSLEEKSSMFGGGDDGIGAPGPTGSSIDVVPDARLGESQDDLHHSDKHKDAASAMRESFRRAAEQQEYRRLLSEWRVAFADVMDTAQMADPLSREAIAAYLSHSAATDKQKEVLERHYGLGGSQRPMTISEIARLFGRHHAAIQKHIKKGTDAILDFVLHRQPSFFAFVDESALHGPDGHVDDIGASVIYNAHVRRASLLVQETNETKLRDQQRAVVLT